MVLTCRTSANHSEPEGMWMVGSSRVRTREFGVVRTSEPPEPLRTRGNVDGRVMYGQTGGRLP